MYVVEKKMSRNPIPFEYGFTNKKDAENFRLKLYQTPALLFKWAGVLEKEKFEWNQSEFVK